MADERFGSGIGAGMALAIGLVVASVIGGWAFVKGKRGDQTITVTGSARKRIKSDLVIWRAGVSYQAPVLADAYRSLSENVPRVKSYLISKGIPEDQITISSISSQTLHSRNEQGEDTGQITGYSLRQELEVRSTDVEKIAKIAREATELINQGILLESMAPAYTTQNSVKRRSRCSPRRPKMPRCGQKGWRKALVAALAAYALPEWECCKSPRPIQTKSPIAA